MKRSLLVFLAVLALGSLTPLLAQAPPAAAPAAPPAAVPAPGLEQFLVTLSGAPVQAPGDGVPAPTFRTGCNTNADCPTGQLCCWLCGNPPDDGSSCKGCVTPTRKGCPMVV
jgi:hypothetical protein